MSLLFKLSCSTVLLVILVYGFYNLPDIAKDPHAPHIGEVINAPFMGSDAIGSWTQGAVVITRAAGGGGITYTRNDTAWLYFMGGDTAFGELLTANNQEI